MNWWNPMTWDWGTVSKDVVAAPLAPLFYLGGAINTATGGTGSWNIWDVVKGTSVPNYSKTTQALSGYHDPSGVPGQGTWGLPVINRDTVPAALDLLGLPAWVLPAAIGVAALVVSRE